MRIKNRDERPPPVAVVELAFIDPGVPDLPALLRGLRPEVGRFLLSPAMPVARQIATALQAVSGLDAIHIIAHGAPGRVNFAAGEWSLATLAADAADLATIGRALGPDGALCLWSCETAAGIAGAAFLDGLAEATGGRIAAAEGPVGGAALGGCWKLTGHTGGASAEPPLTPTAMLRYAAVLAVEVIVAGNLPVGNTTGNVTYFVIDRLRNAIVGQVVLPDATPQGNGVAIPIRVPSGGGSYEIGTFDPTGAFQACAFLRVTGPGGALPPGGPVGFGQ